MSRANLAVVDFAGNVLGYGLYHATSDVVCRNRLLPDSDSPWEEATDDIWGVDCTHKARQNVFIVTDYGFGYYWNGSICPECKVIKTGTIPFDEEGVRRTNGVPPNAPEDIQAWDYRARRLSL